MKKPWEFEDPRCAEVGVELFFNRDYDDGPKNMKFDNYKDAKKICETCDHKIECAEWGIKHEVHGMWGGLTPQERKQIRRTRTFIPVEIIR